MTVSEWLSVLSALFAVVALFVALFRNAWMARQMRLASAVSLVNWLETVRPERQLLYRVRDEGRQLPGSDAENAAADKVARWFEILGLLDNLGYTDRRFVDRFYAIPAFELWAICAPWAHEERKRRGEHHLWEFEQLANRVRNVKAHHPAILKRARWPLWPRR